MCPVTNTHLSCRPPLLLGAGHEGVLDNEIQVSVPAESFSDTPSPQIPKDSLVRKLLPLTQALPLGCLDLQQLSAMKMKAVDKVEEQKIRSWSSMCSSDSSTSLTLPESDFFVM